jgi:L-aspartate oxidase
METCVDTLIIGSGIAGLNLARKLSQAGQKVFLVSKEAITEGSSKYAQGGVAVCSPLNPEDNLESHIQDTLSAAKGLGNEDVVRTILSLGWSKVEEFIKFGVPFDKQFNIEGSHSYKRILHVADATGRAILKPLLDIVSRNHNVAISQGTECISLIKSNNRIVGAAFKTLAGDLFNVLANHTVLSTGGLASLYKEHTTPEILTGDGIALAYDAGAEIENLEFVQFHPTVFKTSRDTNFLISEAVRGAGAVLRNVHGELFAHKYDPRAELATRDIVSRAIISEMKSTQADFVYLDFSQMPANVVRDQFPNIYNFCKSEGYDLARGGGVYSGVNEQAEGKRKAGLLPVRPAAHYSIGGIKTDIHGQTTIAGLYAIGECASNGLHGANRLASNSLLECIVVSDLAAESILADEFLVVRDYQNSSLEFCTEYLELSRKDLERIRETLSENLGLERSEESCKAAIERLSSLPESKAKTAALLIAKSAFLRKESRGAHYRQDCPYRDDSFNRSTLISKLTEDLFQTTSW